MLDVHCERIHESSVNSILSLRFEFEEKHGINFTVLATLTKCKFGISSDALLRCQTVSMTFRES